MTNLVRIVCLGSSVWALSCGGSKTTGAGGSATSSTTTTTTASTGATTSAATGSTSSSSSSNSSTTSTGGGSCSGYLWHCVVGANCYEFVDPTLAQSTCMGLAQQSSAGACPTSVAGLSPLTGCCTIDYKSNPMPGLATCSFLGTASSSIYQMTCQAKGATWCPP